MAGRFFLAAAAFAAAVTSLPAPESVEATTFEYNGTSEDNTPASSALAVPASVPVQSYGGARASSYRHGSAWLPFGASMNPRLSQEATNGRSPLGTFHAPKYPHWISGDGTPLPQGRPWGPRTCGNTDPYKDPPHTGMTRYYDFHVTKQIVSPDGVNRSAIVINGAFPGPTIEANWGDWIEVVVHNDMQEGTSLHWHGLLQKETPWFDGVPSVQQCPIAPGSTLTYRFRADLYGSSWYHSHFSAQAAGGLFGSMIIHGPTDNAQYDEDLGPVLISDWYHSDYFDLVEQTMAPASAGLPPPFSNNNLINGKMNYPCQANDTTCTPNAGVAKFAFETGKKYRLRLINAGAEALQKFSIDNHKMTVIAHDFVPVNPYDADVITLGVGQRTDIVVTATGKSTDAVWMRSTISLKCSLSDGISPEAVAAIYYQNANTSAIPNTTTSVTQAELDFCGNDPLTKATSYFSITPDPNPDVTQNLDITFQSNGTHNLWYMNNSTFRGDYNDPVLLETNLGKTDYEPEWNVLNFGTNKSVRIVIYNHFAFGGHPMHLHGHNMFVLQEGYGKWDGSVVNAHNPQRRDVHFMQPAQSPTVPSYFVLQMDMDNPGVWPLHCHIAWHVSAGLYVNILENPKKIQQMQIPSTMAQTCRDWATWTGGNVVEQIDSGL
ncbi:hypothetical protein B0A48_10149 [Cryoendolithus antarcticus]|uniref:Laccase-2 n=1 Tax=Cryoendolithus antarcticus TaxID=1507870 RepID=A0A1V8SWD5_9PEZI|nr:hypothetical protein B0A48_10149 [Cryoendolithus antarcticus]